MGALRCRACDDAAYHNTRAELFRTLAAEISMRAGKEFANHRDGAAADFRLMASDYRNRASTEAEHARGFERDGSHADGCDVAPAIAAPEEPR